MIKTFRGSIQDTGAFNQQTINLHTNNGLTGYKIKKLQLMPVNPYAQNYEALLQIYTRARTSSSATFNFNDPLLLAAGMYSSNADAKAYPEDQNVVFDNSIINQDIHINYRDFQTNDGMNYYLELEVVTLKLDEAAVATLKDMRGRE